jgi:hypothetical protein
VYGPSLQFPVKLILELRHGWRARNIFAPVQTLG